MSDEAVGGIHQSPIDPLIDSIPIRSMKRSPFRASHGVAAAALAAAALAGSLLSATLVRADQPNMQNALSQLQAAKASLQAASHNKGGHRVNAIQLIDQAMVEVQLGIDVAR